MNFLISVIAVVSGLYLYDFLENIRDYIKSGREHKQLLRWKKECETNIATGKNTEENRIYLQVIEKSLQDFYENEAQKSYNK